MKTKVLLSIGVAAILLAMLLMVFLFDKKQFKIPFKDYSQIEVIYAQITCLNKRIEISKEELKSIADNLCYKKHDWLTNQVDINILVFIKGQEYPLAVMLTESGWNSHLKEGDVFEFKDKELGKKQYQDLWDRAEKSTSYPEPRRYNDYDSLYKKTIRDYLL